jgi:hypothetical protein
MKTIYNILIILVLSVVRIRAAEISVEDFKKMSFEERDKVIEQAST